MILHTTQPAISIQQTRPTIVAPVAIKPTIKAQPVKVMSTDLVKPAVYQAKPEEKRAWAIREIVLARVTEIIESRHYTEEDSLKGFFNLQSTMNAAFDDQCGTWAAVIFPHVEIIAARARVSGMPLERYAAKHPTLLVELKAYWNRKEMPLSVEAQRVIRFTGLMLRMVEKGCQRTSREYRELLKPIIMSTDHRPDVIFDAIEQDEAAWGMYDCVDTRLGNLIDCRGTYNERCQLQRKYLGDWWGLKWPNEPILMAAVRLSGLTWKEYAAKHPNLPRELAACWDWDEEGMEPTEISREAARIMRHTNLLIRLIKKSRMKKSKKYQRLSRMQTLHYREGEAA